MKRSFLLILLISFFSVKSQEVKRYASASGEINFSNARIISESGEEGGSVTRFAPWFNLQMYNNWDKRTHGYFAGLSVRNIGFIYKNGNEMWKVRNYALGIPIGFKWGDMDKMFIYAGYEFEVPINYKEKYFQNDVKERVFNVWFSDRVNSFTHSAFVGLNFKYGFNVKFKYYFTEFFNPNYNNSSIADTRDIRYSGGAIDPKTGLEIPAREKLTVNVFYFALSWNMFRKPYYYYKAEEKVEQADMIY